MNVSIHCEMFPYDNGNSLVRASRIQNPLFIVYEHFKRKEPPRKINLFLKDYKRLNIVFWCSIILN